MEYETFKLRKEILSILPEVEEGSADPKIKEEQVYFKLRWKEKEQPEEGITPGLPAVLLHNTQTHRQQAC